MAQAIGNQQMMTVVCPQGVEAGGKMMAQTPTGQQVQVQVPAGVTPGMQ